MGGSQISMGTTGIRRRSGVVRAFGTHLAARHRSLQQVSKKVESSIP